VQIVIELKPIERETNTFFHCQAKIAKVQSMHLCLKCIRTSEKKKLVWIEPTSFPQDFDEMAINLNSVNHRLLIDTNEYCCTVISQSFFQYVLLIQNRIRYRDPTGKSNNILIYFDINFVSQTVALQRTLLIDAPGA